MAMKASVSGWSYRWFFNQGKMDLESFVDEVKRLKADGFEIFPQHVDPDDPGGHLKKVARKARRLKLEISSLIAGNDFARPTAAQRAEQVERMKQSIINAAGAGIRRVNTFTGYHQAGQDPFLEAAHVIACYREVMPVAEKYNVVLCLENHSSVNPDCDGLLAIIRAVGSPNLRTNPDPTNFVPDFHIRGERAAEVIYKETERYAPLMANAHLKIADFKPNGEHAHISVKRILDIFRKVGFDGHVVTEVYEHPEQAPEITAKGLALIRKYR